jgi:hypothetical protein
VSSVKLEGSSLLVTKLTPNRNDIITTTLDKLEAQLSIPADQMKRLGHARTTMQVSLKPWTPRRTDIISSMHLSSYLIGSIA